MKVWRTYCIAQGNILNSLKKKNYMEKRRKIYIDTHTHTHTSYILYIIYPNIYIYI